MVKQSGHDVHKAFKLKSEVKEDKPKAEEKKPAPAKKVENVAKVTPKAKATDATTKKIIKKEAAPGFALEFAPLIDQPVRVVLQSNESMEGVLVKAYMYTLHLKVDKGTIVFMKSAVAYVTPV